ncbi:MAG: methyltransferase domain-containing protein [Deltaproteobacteria bacterium]|nr:methyltransferase domain-containing protein [Deltaproteobacteria bacterium]
MAPPAPLRFLRQSLQQAQTVGALWPSSKGLSRAMVEPVFAEVHKSRERLRVLEVGAGVGPVTEELVARLLPGDRLDVVELNPEFCAVLCERFAAAPVAPTVHQVSIADFNPGVRYHHIVSGLPLANFPANLVETIYQRIFDLLEPSGSFVMFEHVLGREILNTFASGEARDRIARLLEIEAELEPLVVSSKTVPINMPPARVVVRRHPAAGRAEG